MNCLPILDVSIDDGLGFDIELGSLAGNIKKEVCGVIDSFFYLTRYDEKRAHNMLALMLNLIFKNLILFSFFINHEQRVTTVEEYDNLFFIFSRSYHHLHPLSKVDSSFINMIDQNNNLDIFVQ
jgi:hypothetical protein